MKALSVCQPWAWAIIHGPKRIENRSRPTRHRGPLVIHASRSRRYLAGDYSALLPDLQPWEQLDFGCLVGLVEVVDCVPLAEVQGDPFAQGPWCWILANPRPIKPVPFKGQVYPFPVSRKLVVPLGKARRAGFSFNGQEVK
jgi:ASCH domain